MTDPKDDADDLDQEPLDEDTPDPDDADGQDTPEDAAQPTDWEARYKEQQKVLARQGQELGVWRRGEKPATSRRSEAAPKPAEGDDEADDDGYVAVLEADSWRAAEALYGEGAVEAYSAAYEIFERAQTPADYIAAFEAYHDLRSNGGSAADAAAAAAAAGEQPARRSRSEAVQPRVDLNRSDAGPDLNDKSVEEARKSGDLGKFVSAATRAMGFGGGTRSG